MTSIEQRLDPAASEEPGTILGLDNVPLNLPIAGVGSRVLAGAIDYLIQGILQWGWLIAGVLWLDIPHSGGGVAVFLTGFLLIDWCYFAGSEILLGQQTLGKKALRLRVVTGAGGSPDVSSLWLRNLTRIVDLFVGVPAMALDPFARRLGDRLAGTLVVHDERGRGLLLHRIPEGWGARDVAIVESLLGRSREMESWRVEKMARTLLETLGRQHPAFLKDLPAGLPPVEALRQAFDARTS